MRRWEAALHRGPGTIGKPRRVPGRGGRGPRGLRGLKGGWRGVRRARSEAPGVAGTTQECGSGGDETEVLREAARPGGAWEDLADETGDRDAEQEAEEPQDSFQVAGGRSLQTERHRRREERRVLYRVSAGAHETGIRSEPSRPDTEARLLRRLGLGPPACGAVRSRGEGQARLPDAAGQGR